MKKVIKAGLMTFMVLMVGACKEDYDKAYDKAVKKVASKIVEIRGEDIAPQVTPSTQKNIKKCYDGDAAICATLGSFYAKGNKGIGIPKDEKKALEFYKLACEGGHENACKKIGK